MKKKIQIFVNNILSFYEDLLLHGYYHDGCYHL